MSLVLMPYTFIFGIVLPLTYPVVDAVLIWSLLSGFWLAALTPVLVFTLVDILYAMWGLRGEQFGWRLLWMVPIQRLCYRQLLYYTVARAVVRAIEGTGASWNKVKKAGETQRFYIEHFGRRYSA
jgi:hypothetical protein